MLRTKRTHLCLRTVNKRTHLFCSVPRGHICLLSQGDTSVLLTLRGHTVFVELRGHINSSPIMALHGFTVVCTYAVRRTVLQN